MPSDSFLVRRLFNVCVLVFVPQMRQFSCLHTRQDQNEVHLKIWFFFAKIGNFCKSIAGLLSEAKTHWVLNWLQLLNQLNFVWRHTKVFMQHSSQWCLRNDQLLRTTVNWWRLTHTLCHTSNILACFWLFTLWFIDEDASFFHFFRKITNIRSSRCFSSSKSRRQFSYTFWNITMIFKVISQYFPALFKRIPSCIRLAEG